MLFQNVGLTIKGYCHVHYQTNNWKEAKRFDSCNIRVTKEEKNFLCTTDFPIFDTNKDSFA